MLFNIFTAIRLQNVTIDEMMEGDAAQMRADRLKANAKATKERARQMKNKAVARVACWRVEKGRRQQRGWRYVHRIVRFLLIKKPRHVAVAGFYGFNRQLTCASVGLESVLDASSQCGHCCVNTTGRCRRARCVASVSCRTLGQRVSTSQ